MLDPLAFDPGQGFLGKLDPADRALLLGGARRVAFGDGALIVTEGDATGDVYVLLTGCAVAMLMSSDGKIVTYSDIGPGGLFGEIAAIDARPRSAFVQARGATTAAALTPTAFLAALAASPTLSLALMRHLAAMVRDTTTRVFQSVTMPVRTRLVLELLRRATPDPAANGSDACLVATAPTHFDLAARIGGHREGVTKELSALARAGLIAREGRTLRIPSRARLAAQIESWELDEGARGGG